MPLKMWAIIREVVVLPLVPVTATIGIRLGAPGGNSMSTTGLATYCGSPTVGWVCIRKPGAAFTSQMPPPVSRTGWVMSGAMKSIPAMSRPTTRAASSAISMFSGWASMVRSMEMPPVDMLPVRVSLTWCPAGGTSSMPNPWAAHQVHGGLVDLDPGQHLLVADAAAGVGVGLLHQLADRAPAVADHVGRHPLGDRGDPAVDHQAAVVPAGDEGLHDDQPAARLRLGHLERPAYVVVGPQVEHHAAAVVAVQRLEHHRDSRSGWPAGPRPRPYAPTPSAAPAARRRRAG